MGQIRNLATQSWSWRHEVITGKQEGDRARHSSVVFHGEGTIAAALALSIHRDLDVWRGGHVKSAPDVGR